MGPLAFQYKDGNGVKTQEANVGDWVLIRWGAGTMFQAGKGILNAVGGWRYLSSFNDVIKIIPASAMPDPATLEWTDEGVIDGAVPNPAQSDLAFDADAGVRERVVYPSARQ